MARLRTSSAAKNLLVSPRFKQGGFRYGYALPVTDKVDSMKLLQIVPHIDQEASGPTYVLYRLCEALAELGDSVELKCLAAGAPIPGVKLSVHQQWGILPRFAVSSDMMRAMRHAAGEVDVLHNHSLWSMVNVASGVVNFGRKAKLVTSPHGTLSTWALNRRRVIKRILWPAQRLALTRADLIHVTSEDEYQEVRALKLRVPVAIVPNGIDIPEASVAVRAEAMRTLLFLSRIHPKKGIDTLLCAWQRLERHHPNWRLEIVGAGEAEHVAHVKALAARLDVQRVVFTGPAYGAAKDAAYDGASLFVLPTYSENFAMVVAEALARGCPAVVTHGAPWSGLESEQCGWWIENDLDVLHATLDHALALTPESLAIMGRNGRRWMGRDFGWSTIAGQLHAAYHWIVFGGSPPDCVRLD